MPQRIGLPLLLVRIIIFIFSETITRREWPTNGQFVAFEVQRNDEVSATPVELSDTDVAEFEGHYYAVIPSQSEWIQNTLTAGTHQEALNAASLMTYNGMQGHLVTITSAEENQFITTLLSDDAVTPVGNITLLALIRIVKARSSGLMVQRLVQMLKTLTQTGGAKVMVQVMNQTPIYKIMIMSLPML